jgi:hypothetical protein
MGKSAIVPVFCAREIDGDPRVSWWQNLGTKPAFLPILLFDPGGAILPPRPQFDCAIVSSGGQGWPHFSRPPEGFVLDGREHDGTLAVSERKMTMRGSGARLVTMAIVAASRFPFRSLYRSSGTPIGKPIDYLDFATIELPAPA